MPIGSITNWNLDRGFGFIGDDTQPRSRGAFVHISALDGVAPMVGDVFEYEVRAGLDGRERAANLMRLDCVESDEAERAVG